MLPAPLSKIDVEGDTVAAVTDTARQVYLDQVSMVISKDRRVCFKYPWL